MRETRRRIDCGFGEEFHDDEKVPVTPENPKLYSLQGQGDLKSY
jgi:hypothetical protein